MSDVGLLPEQLPEVDSSSSEAPPSNGTNSTGGLDGGSVHPTWGSLNYTLPTLIVVAAVLFVVIVATAFGNFLVVLALFKYRSLRTISNYLIANLALGDFLLATTILPLSTVNECLGHWVFGQALCNAWLIMDALYCTASIWNILVIAFDRFTATLYPIWYREKRSTKKAAIYIALVWLISCAICLPPVLGWNDLSYNYVYEGNTYKCILFQTKSYVLYSACGSFYIPFFMTFFFYMAIFIALRDRMRKTRKARTSTTTTTITTTTTTTTTTDKRKLDSRQKTPNEKRNRLMSKSHRLQKEYKLELVKADDRKKMAAADAAEENSSKSLFGSDSDRERSASDVEADETTTAMTSRETEISRVTRDEISGVIGAAPSNADVIRRHSVHGVGFVPMTSRHATSDDAVKSSSSSSSERPASISASSAKDNTNNDGGQNVELGRSPDSIMAEHRGVAGVAEPVHLSPPESTAAAEGVAKRRSTPSKTTTMTKSAAAAAKQQQQQQSCRRGRYEQREMRATVRMAIIIAFFCGMWVGFFTVYVLGSWCPGCNIPRELDAFFFWLGYSNSSINPILYTIFNDDFRKAFVQIVGCHVTRKTKR